MGQFKMKAGRKVFRLISNQWAFDLFVTGRSTFLLSERSLSFNNAMITLTSARWSACIVELTSVKTGRFLAKHTRGHFHLKIGKTECIYSPVKRFTAVYTRGECSPSARLLVPIFIHNV